jgi:FlaA1/EpsC-like NDP-sugar epimerase
MGNKLVMSDEITSSWNNLRFMSRIGKLISFRIPFLIIFQFALIIASYIGSYVLYFNGDIPDLFYRTMLLSLPLLLVVQGYFFTIHYNIHRGLWRYVAFADLKNILRASLASMIVIVIIDIFTRPYIGEIPSSIIVIDLLLIITLTGGCRLMVRHLRESYLPPALVKRVMLVGPVKDVEPLLREMYGHDSEYLPVVMIDPDIHLRGYRLYDVPIMGGIHHLIKGIQRHKVQEIIFAWPDASSDMVNEIIETGKRYKVRCKKIPPLSEVLGGRYRIADVRDIELEDLLPRPPIYFDQDHISNFIQNQVILVTGGGGSIGSELCRQVAQFHPRTLVIFDRAENSLYEIEMELRRRFPDLNLQPLVVSINDAAGLEQLLQQCRPQLVFHAAAYKHVPLMEHVPLEAAYNNIIGTRNLVRAALAAQTERFVMISTDKAVNPTSVMGVCKRVAEKYVQALNDGQSTCFITTRFGNVLGSAGSVIPILKQQLAQGGPLTVTHPEMERFFMTISEAVQLVLQAAFMGQGSDIFVLQMGRLVKISQLAENLITLAGKTPGKDVEIKFIGLRPGEKLYEELFNIDEEPQPTEHPLISRAIGPKEPKEVWERHLDEIQDLFNARDAKGLIAKFKTIIPNYNPPSQESDQALFSNGEVIPKLSLREKGG